MADLVALADLKAFLGIASGDTSSDVVLTALLASALALFTSECGRQDAPFQDAAAGRVERVDGTGGVELFTDYPIATLTSVVITWPQGVGVTPYTETLDVDDATVLAWRQGKARLVRVDGGVFGPRCWPACVTITYDAQADLPADARLAIHRAVATVFWQRGAEDATSETIGGATQLAKVLADDPLWAAAVHAHTRRTF